MNNFVIYLLLCSLTSSTISIAFGQSNTKTGKMDKLVCTDDFHKEAAKLLELNTLEYFESGADDEYAVRESNLAFQRWIVRPRFLRDVSSRNLSTLILGKPVKFPIGIAPMAMQKLAHPDGELALAKAAASLGTIYVLSTMSTSSIEDVAAAAPTGRNWFQLYYQKNLEVNKDLISRAERSGFEALVLTLDTQLIGKRRANLRNPIKVPDHLKLANFGPRKEGENISSSEALASMRNNSNPVRDMSVTWDVVIWLRNTTRMPIILKGILTAEDAALAAEHGVDAIIVSNHGGRQLDCSLPPIMALEEIVKSVSGKCEVYMDGGITLGSDAFKALALGAKMVFAGRAIIWGLAVGGESGAQKSLQILRDELDHTMTLSGVADIRQINPSFVGQYSRM